MLRRPYGFESTENCQACAWRNDRFFCDLPPPALAVFDRVSFIHVYPQASVLFSEGQSPRGLYMICRGSAKLTIGSGDGRTLVLHIAHAGEALGLSSVMSGHDHKTTAETLEPTQIRFIKRDDFLRLSAEYHEACHHTALQLSEECEANTDQVRSIGLSHSAAEKLAHLFLTWCAENGRETEEGIRVPMLMTHHDMAQLIGTSRETVTRLLKDFRDQGIISTKGSTLTVRNRGALQALVTM
jgi:CRP/FNR family transcriptional regulator